MGLNAFFESEADVPEPLRDFYVQDEKSGGFVLDVDNVDSLPKVRGLVTANTSNKNSRDQLKQKLADYDARFSWVPEDFDADAFESLKQAAEGKTMTDDQIADMRTKIQTKLSKSHDAEMGQANTKIQSLETALNKKIIDGDLSAAADAAYINPAFKDAAIALIKQTAKIELSQEGDNFSATVDTDLGPVSIKEYVAEFASGAGKQFVAKPKGPDPRGGVSRGGAFNQKRSEMTPEEKANYTSEHGQTAFLSLPK